MVVVCAGISTPGANTKTADLVTGQWQFVQKGLLRLAAKSSATGIQASLACNGVSIVDDVMIPFTGTAGTLSKADNVLAEQMVAGGRVQLFLRNSTATAGTTSDYYLEWLPM
jgi:hypothetical protein